MARLKKGVVPKTNAEKQAEFRKRMKDEGFTQRMLWIKAGEPTPTPELIGELQTALETAQHTPDTQADFETLQRELTELKAAADTAKAQWEAEKIALQEELKAAAVPIDTSELDQLQNENNELKQALEKVQQAPIPKAKRGQRENPREGLMKKEHNKGYIKGILASCNFLLSKGTSYEGIIKELLSNFDITKAKVDEFGISIYEQADVHRYLE